MFEDDSSIHLVMQLCSGGALFERIEKERYSEKYIVLLVRSILRFISQVWSRLGGGSVISISQVWSRLGRVSMMHASGFMEQVWSCSFKALHKLPLPPSCCLSTNQPPPLVPVESTPCIHAVPRQGLHLP